MKGRAPQALALSRSDAPSSPGAPVATATGQRRGSAQLQRRGQDFVTTTPVFWDEDQGFLFGSQGVSEKKTFWSWKMLPA